MGEGGVKNCSELRDVIYGRPPKNNYESVNVLFFPSVKGDRSLGRVVTREILADSTFTRLLTKKTFEEKMIRNS